MGKLSYHVGLAIVIALQVIILVPHISGREESTEWSVSARCSPHAEVVAPQTVQIRVAFSATREGPALSAFMTVHGTPNFNSNTGIAYWGFPQRKWVSFIFDGPPVSNKYFCQTEWGDKQLHLWYSPADSLKIHYSVAGGPSSIELDSREAASLSVLTLHSEGENTTYSAGAGMANPYWLQFSVPIYDSQSATTTLFVDFQ